ncbi:MAG: mannose-6-phosphate isomerase, partial [Chloroflexi bacterium]
KQYGAALAGEGNNPDEGFPLLAKLLDASDWLSVQVHPNDEQARQLEGDPRGKTEAWVILAAEPGAKLVIGVKPGTTREQLAQAIRDGCLEELLIFADVKAGDVVYLAANTIHAIGPGLLIYEIQQSSDVTYRLYDWNRLGLDGKPRELHIEKGTQVSNVETLPPITHIDAERDQAIIVEGEYFRTARHRLSGAPQSIQTQGRFHALTCVEGEAVLTAGDTTLNLSIGRTALVPAAVTSYSLSGDGVLLRSWQTR